MQPIPQMFDTISPTYDALNRLLSLGLDQVWRAKIARFLPRKSQIALLDCACGTADLLLQLLRKEPRIQHAVGLDLSSEMLKLAKEKLEKTDLHSKCTLKQADLNLIPYPEHSFDAVTLGFGLRNVPDPVRALREIFRVLTPQGKVLILEFSLPTSPLVREFHQFYLRHVVSRLGGWLSKNPEAYRYLAETIEAFPSGDALLSLLQEAGFKACKAHPLSLGAVTIYEGTKN